MPLRGGLATDGEMTLAQARAHDGVKLIIVGDKEPGIGAVLG